MKKGDDISKRMYNLFSFFVRHQWIFKSEAMERANSKLSEKEKLEFKTDLKDIDWSEYFLDFIKGIKVFVAEMKSKKKGKLNMELLASFDRVIYRFSWSKYVYKTLLPKFFEGFSRFILKFYAPLDS